MTSLQTAFALMPVGYLLGAFPSASIVARIKGHDITKEGSGNPGASNVTRVLGWKLGLLVLIADIGKGAGAAAIGLAIDNHRGAYIVGFAAVLGHVFPVFRRFRGGRGVATAAGILLVIYPLLTLGLGVLWFAIARLTRKASIASLVLAFVFPISVSIAHPHIGDIVVSSALGLVVLLRHLGSLRRLLRGSEPDFRSAPDTHGESVGP